MYEIRELSGQEYVDTYATKQAEVAPAEVATVTPLPTVGNGGGAHRRSSADVLKPTGAMTGGR